MQYFEPNFVDEALVLLDRFAPDARVLAGGTLLGFEVRAHPNAPSTIVNVKRIPELHDISFDGRALQIGALATARELATHELVRRHAPLVALAAASVGARQLRTVATLGGNLCSGHHAADLSVALLALDCTCLISDITAGPSRMPVADFLQEMTKTRDRRTLLTGVEIPVSKAAIAYQKMAIRRAFEMAIASVAVAVELEGGTVSRARIALGGAAAHPLRADHAQSYIAGKPAVAATAREAAQIAAAQDANPPADHRASAAYRRNLIRVLAERALNEAFVSGVKAG